LLGTADFCEGSGMRPQFLVIGLALLIYPATAMASLPPATVTATAAAPLGPLGAVSVRKAGVLLELYPLPRDLVSLLPQWQTALRAALLRSRIFRGGPAPPLSVTARVIEFARTGNTLTVFTRYEVRRPTSTAPVFRVGVMTDVGVTSTDGIDPLVDSDAALRDPQQVDRAVHANTAEFVDQLEAFVKNNGPLVARAG
jgi:hypothetical protein